MVKIYFMLWFRIKGETAISYYLKENEPSPIICKLVHVTDPKFWKPYLPLYLLTHVVTSYITYLLPLILIIFIKKASKQTTCITS